MVVTIDGLTEGAAAVGHAHLDAALAGALGAHTHHGIAPMDFSVAEDWSGHWQRVNLLSVALWYIAAKQGNSMQSLLREINPRMRKGMPSQEALRAHRGLWLRSLGKENIAIVLSRLLEEFPSPRDAESFFWPCGDNYNKTRWPTDAQGNML